MKIIPLVLFGLSVLTPIVAFAEWMLGESGAQRVKNRLANWYVYLEDSDWSAIVNSGARSIDGFFNTVLGSSLIGVRPLTLGFIFSFVVLFFGLLGITSILAAIPRLEIGQSSITDVARIALLYAVLDTFALVASRWLLRRIVIAKDAAAFALGVAGLMLVVYTVGAAVMIISDPQVLHQGPRAFLYAAEWGFNEDYTQLNLDWGVKLSLLLGAVSGSPSSWLLLLYIVGACLLYVSRPITRKPLALLVERLAESPRGAFTALFTLLTALSGVLTAYSKLQ